MGTASSIAAGDVDASALAHFKHEYEAQQAAGADDLQTMRHMMAELPKLATTKSKGGRKRLRDRNLFQPGLRMSALRRVRSSNLGSICANAEQKDEATVAMLRAALQRTLFQASDSAAIQAVLDSMTQQTFDSNTNIITQGETGKNFCVVASGAVDVLINGDSVKTLEAGAHFGELSLIYEEPVSATIRAKTGVSLWSLSSSMFRQIQQMTASNSISQRAKWLKSVDTLKDCDSMLLSRVAHVLDSAAYKDGDVIVQQGDVGDTFFIIESGQVAVHQQNARRSSIDAAAGAGAGAADDSAYGRQEDIMQAGAHFGEVALTTGCTRNATCVAMGDVKCLTMRREDFQDCLGSLEQVLDRHNSEQALKKVPELRSLAQGTALSSLVRNDLQQVDISAGDVIAKAGETARGVYIIKDGSFECGSDAEMSTGLCFGEGSLRDPPEGEPLDITATASSTCMLLDATVARQALGLPSPGEQDRKASMTMCSGPMSRIKLEDLEFVALLGEGSFGRVTMVKSANPQTEEVVVLALKRMCKQHIIDDGQQDHIKLERDILSSIRPHPFLLHLYATYQDENCVYLLTNVLLGGELFTVIHPADGDSCLALSSARFYAANVFLAIEHLHRSGVIYRDMKPENVLVSADGYLCIIDMGFAKFVPFNDEEDGTEHEHTYTMCGTPEYMAPEFILQTGHNHGVDYWALGVLVYEMLFGVTPFLPEDEDMGELFKNIARVRTRKPKGRARPPNIAFPEGYLQQHPSVVQFIHGLLDGDPTHRLGMMQNGSDDVRQHLFFESLDWAGLLNKTLAPPFAPKLRNEFDTSHFEGEESGELDLIPLLDTKTTVFDDF